MPGTILDIGDMVVNKKYLTLCSYAIQIMKKQGFIKHQLYTELQSRSTEVVMGEEGRGEGLSLISKELRKRWEKHEIFIGK
jgi:hypothetical protein